VNPGLFSGGDALPCKHAILRIFLKNINLYKKTRTFKGGNHPYTSPLDPPMRIAQEPFE